jgi:uncharacterized protein YndB with AHSA1/START domain
VVDILHKVGIKSSSQNDVYKTLTTVEGLSAWWTNDTRGESNVGGVLLFRFGGGGFDMKVLELQPAKRVLWQVVDWPEEWIGTKISWDLKQEDDWTIILFKHEGVEGAGGVHAPLQHQVGGLSAKPKVASRNREGRPPSKRCQARQVGIKTRPLTKRNDDRLQDLNK